MNRLGIYIDAKDLYHATWRLGPYFNLHSAKPDYNAIAVEALQAAASNLDGVFDVAVKVIYTVARDKRATAFWRAMRARGFETFIHLLEDDAPPCRVCRTRADAFSWETEIMHHVTTAAVIDRKVDAVVVVSGSPRLGALRDLLADASIPALFMAFPDDDKGAIRPSYALPLTPACMTGERYTTHA